jgi:hypothetical protein
MWLTVAACRQPADTAAACNAMLMLIMGEPVERTTTFTYNISSGLHALYLMLFMHVGAACLCRW